MIEQTYELSMIPFEEQARRDYEIPIVPVSQYDKILRTLIFELYDGAERFVIPANAVAYIFGMKPDGNAFQYEMIIEDNTAKIDVQTQMTTVAGCVTCEIVFFEENTSGNRIGSANFKLMVEHCAVGDDAEFSRSDMPVIQTLIFGGTAGDVLVKDVNGVAWSSEAPSEGYMRYAQYDPEITGTVNSARNSEKVDGHTVARNVLANEYTNEQIDEKIAQGGGGGSAVWGKITGDISNQADLERRFSEKVTKVAGKGLSTNDFTDQWRNKLEGIAEGAEVNVQANWDQTVTTADDYIKNKPSIPENTSDLVNDSGYITANEAPVQGVKGSSESRYRTGNVSISKTDIGLSEVNNTSDANKPISTATQTALNAKQDKLTAGANITIDANNVISASGGEGGGAVDSVNGKTGVVVLDAEDVGALPDSTTASDLGAYVKPTGGIPKSDLASAVQTSLGKADTALQSAPVTSVNSKTGSVVLSASDVGAYVKPTGGIPKTDLASAVQTSLEKADTALQSAPVTSVNGKTGAVSLTASDVSALPSSTAIPSKTSDLTNDSGFLTSANAVTSFNGKTGAVTYTAPVTSVNGQTGAVTVDTDWGNIGGDIDDQTDLKNRLDAKINTSNVATIESSSTASNAYKVGDYLVYNGQLYEAITSIVVGETLIVDTNIQATTVGEELSELKSGLFDYTIINSEDFPVNEYVSYDETYCRIVYTKNIVHFQFRMTAKKAIPAYQLFFKIPTPVVPSIFYAVPIYLASTFIGTMRIQTDGYMRPEMQIQSGTTFEGWVAFIPRIS